MFFTYFHTRKRISRYGSKNETRNDLLHRARFAVLEEQVFKGVVTARVLCCLDGFFRLTGIPSQLRIVARGEDVDDLHLVERPRVHVGTEIELRNGAEKEGFARFPRFARFEPCVGSVLESLVAGLSTQVFNGFEQRFVLRHEIFVSGKHDNVDILLDDLLVSGLVGIFTQPGFEFLLQHFAQCASNFLCSEGFLAIDVVAERLGDGLDGSGGGIHGLEHLLRELVVALGGYVVEDGDAVFGVVELTVARAEERIADGEDVVLIVFARVPRIPRFDGIKSFGDLAFVVLLEGITDFLFADFAGNFHATVDKLLNSIELRLEIGRARRERAIFALGVRRFALEQTGIRHRLAFGIIVRFVLFNPSTQQRLRIVDKQARYKIV